MFFFFYSFQQYYEVTRDLPVLPPRRPGDLPITSSTENIYESIRDNETYYGIKDDSLKRDIKQGTLSESVAQEIFSQSSLDDDAYAVVPDLMVPSDTFPSEKGAPVLPNQDKTTSLNKETNRINDESGYLLPEGDDDVDVSVFGLAFPSKRNSSTDQVSSFKVGKATSLVDESGYLLSRATEQHENDNSTRQSAGGVGYFSPRNHDLIKKKSSTYPASLQNDAEMIRHTYFGYNDSSEDVQHGRVDTQNMEDKEYCDINQDDNTSRSKIAQCQKYETIGDPISPSSAVDDIGYLVPSGDEEKKKRPSLPSIPMKRESTGDGNRRVSLKSAVVVEKSIGCVISSDDDGYTADDLQIQHSYLDLADVIQKSTVKDQESGDSEHAKYSQITAETSTCDSKEYTVKGKDGTGLLDQMPGLVDDLGYLVLSTEEQSQSQNLVSPLVDDGGYLVPNFELVDMIKRHASQSATKNPQNPGLDDIQHSYFGLNDSVSGTEENRGDGAGDDIAYSEIAPNDTSNKKKNVVYDSIDQHVPSSSDTVDNAPEDLRHIYFDSADLVQQQRQGVSHQSEASGRRKTLGGGKAHTRPEEGNVQTTILDQFGYLILDKT